MVNIILHKDEILAEYRYISIAQITAMHSPILSQIFPLTHLTTQKSTIVAIMLNRGICPLCSNHLSCFIDFCRCQNANVGFCACKTGSLESYV